MRDPLRVAGIEVAAALEDFEHIFVISQPDHRRAVGADFGDVKRCVESLLLRRRLFEIAANAILPQGGVAVIIIKRRAAVGEKRGGHAGSVALDGRGVQ